MTKPSRVRNRFTEGITTKRCKIDKISPNREIFEHRFLAQNRSQARHNTFCINFVKNAYRDILKNRQQIVLKIWKVRNRFQLPRYYWTDWTKCLPNLCPRVSCCPRDFYFSAVSPLNLTFLILWNCNIN